MPPLADVERWQAALALYDETLSRLLPGSSIGLIAAEAALNGAAGGTGSRMLTWQVTETGLRVQAGTFPGFSKTDVDILMAADDSALVSIDESLETDLFAAVRRLIREGHILFFARKTQRELEDAGYEDLLDQLGRAFMGACR